MDKTAAESAQLAWLCTGCHSPRRGVQAVDVTIQGENQPDDPPLNFVYGFGVPLALRDFLLSFGEDAIERNLWIGRVFLSNGKPSENWVTFRGKHRLIVRGSKNAGHRKCPECGRTLYFAMGSRYLCPAPSSDVAVFESDLRGLIVTEQLLSLIKLNQWRKLVVDKLPVQTTPKDGLPESLEG